MSGEIDTARLLDVATRIKRATRNADLLALCEGVAVMAARIAELERVGPTVTDRVADVGPTPNATECPDCAKGGRRSGFASSAPSSDASKVRWAGRDPDLIAVCEAVLAMVA
jgi:hypothetical protein